MNVWPAIIKPVSAMGPDALDAAGILSKTDPFWGCIDNMVANQVEYYLSMTAKEDGGLYNCTVRQIWHLSVDQCSL